MKDLTSQFNRYPPLTAASAWEPRVEKERPDLSVD
jgi:hypothetical protein